jgi:hypothetical protein
MGVATGVDGPFFRLRRRDFDYDLQPGALPALARMNSAVVQTDDAAADRQAEAISMIVCAGCQANEAFEYAFALVGRHSRPLVLD